jgi:PBP1b-binding outer membrane lipoprotein LpoB
MWERTVRIGAVVYFAAALQTGCGSGAAPEPQQNGPADLPLAPPKPTNVKAEAQTMSAQTETTKDVKELVPEATNVITLVEGEPAVADVQTASTQGSCKEIANTNCPAWAPHKFLCQGTVPIGNCTHNGELAAAGGITRCCP